MKRKPSAICIAADLCTAVFITALQEDGVTVPRDLSIVSQDEIKGISTVAAVPLTMVPQPMETIAHNIIELLASRLSREYSGAARCVEVRGELMIRKSMAAYS